MGHRLPARVRGSWGFPSGNKRIIPPTTGYYLVTVQFPFAVSASIDPSVRFRLIIGTRVTGGATTTLVWATAIATAQAPTDPGPTMALSSVVTCDVALMGIEVVAEVVGGGSTISGQHLGPAPDPPTLKAGTLMAKVKPRTTLEMSYAAQRRGGRVLCPAVAPRTHEPYPVTTRYAVPGKWEAGHHTGEDHACPVGSLAVSTAWGRVVAVGPDGQGYGRAYGTIVVVRTKPGWDLMFCHLSHTALSVGVRVSAGDGGRVDREHREHHRPPPPFRGPSRRGPVRQRRAPRERQAERTPAAVTTNLRVVIIALAAVLCMVVAGMVTIAVVQITNNHPVSIPQELVTIAAGALGALVGMLVPAEIKRGRAGPTNGAGGQG